MKTKIKLSKKSQNRIIGAVSDAFCDIVKEFLEYDSPPDLWTDEEKGRWDLLQELADKAQKRILEITKTY